MKLQRITDMRGNNISLRTKNTPNSKLIYDTLRPAETYVDQGKDADANTHSEGSQAKPSQSSNWEAKTYAERKSTSPCLLAIPAFDSTAGLYNRHFNSNRGIC